MLEQYNEWSESVTKLFSIYHFFFVFCFIVFSSFVPSELRRFLFVSLFFYDCSVDGVFSVEYSKAQSLSKSVIFEDGRGYIEKDWGRGFPTAWVWVQCNGFPTRGVSLSASSASVPFLGKSFPGYIVGLQIGDALHRFTTYVGARIERLETTDRSVDWTLTNKTHTLRIRARPKTLSSTVENSPLLLHVPDESDMIAKIPEFLGVEVEVELRERTKSKKEEAEAVVFHEIGVGGAMEVVNYQALLEMLKI